MSSECVMLNCVCATDAHLREEKESQVVPTTIGNYGDIEEHNCKLLICNGEQRRSAASAAAAGKKRSRSSIGRVPTVANCGRKTGTERQGKKCKPVSRNSSRSFVLPAQTVIGTRNLSPPLECVFVVSCLLCGRQIVWDFSVCPQ